MSLIRGGVRIGDHGERQFEIEGGLETLVGIPFLLLGVAALLGGVATLLDGGTVIGIPSQLLGIAALLGGVALLHRPDCRGDSLRG